MSGNEDSAFLRSMGEDGTAAFEATITLGQGATFANGGSTITIEMNAERVAEVKTARARAEGYWRASWLPALLTVMMTFAAVAVTLSMQPEAAVLIMWGVAGFFIGAALVLLHLGDDLKDSEP